MDGLILHLDAGAQAEAFPRQSLPAPVNGSGMDRCLNAVEGGLHAVQPLAGMRPVYLTDGKDAFLRFDGKNDFLTVSGGRRLAAEVTVLVLAAPRSNAGGFRAMLSMTEAGRNDYTNGLNIDLGPQATDELSVLNVETAGCSGFQDLLQPGNNLAADLPFGGFHVFTVRSRIGDRGNEIFVDGIPVGQRTRLESHIGLDDIIVGARLLSHDPAEAAFVQGYFHGDIAAIAVYDRWLSDPERQTAEDVLFRRVPQLNALAEGRSGHALEVLADPPPVQMLVPGFAVDELPVSLTNLTNVRYRHDGRLVALGYDGRIHLLSDTDGDGLEDTASVFQDQFSLRGPIGMALLPAGDPRGDGVYVASKGKISLILDRDRDGRADEEVIVSTGWREIFTNVDATGLAVDPKDGSIYFALGVENFANAYLIDPATGKSGFRLSSDRGTIQRVPADFSGRETVCTGVRFACALAFNREGDLFATEQEGATWLPNGNPLDELLHIVPGRHYGFPPRHPRHLPDVIDEPAVMEYGPQHQSTVGMVFNESVNGGPVFGPDSWAGDAIVCGESRGKLYRTRLVRTPAGYVAQNHLIACLSLLTVDACVSPAGDLVVACHSGPPDWGTGPTGTGRLFRIRYADRDVPQPVMAWAAAPDEFRIAFDRPLNPQDWAGARDRVRVEAGKFVMPGDRYEVIRPGYQVVRDQMGAPRRWIDVHSLTVSADLRTLVIRVPKQTEATGYAITLPVPSAWMAEGTIAQRAEMDIGLTLNGIEARTGDGAEAVAVVLPHPAAQVSRALTAGSADHEAFFAALERPGAKLTLRGGIDDSNIFVPATQPGAVLDWDIGSDAFAARRMTVRVEDGGGTRPVPVDGPDRIRPLHVKAAGPGGTLTFALDDRVRPVPLHRLFVPWAEDGAPSPAAVAARDDVRGNWLHGRRLFFGQAGCFTCHTIRGEGIAFGPDLTNLVFRDRDSVIHDILKPSATISPDQPGTLVTFRDGASAAGIVRTLTDDRIVVALPGGAELIRPRSDVTSMELMRTSLMPEGFGSQLSEPQQEDLLTFLLTNPLEPAPITRRDPPMPSPRKRQDVVPHLSASGLTDSGVAVASAPDLPPLRILLCADTKDHGTDEHDYPLWLERWKTLLGLADNVTVTTCMGFPSREQLAEADVTVFYSRNSGWNPRAAGLLDEYQQRGGGLVYLHWAMEGGPHAAALAERIGLATAFTKFRHGEIELVFTRPDHPVTAGFDRLPFVDETYWGLHGDVSRVSVLGTAVEEGAPRPQIWTLERNGARVFGCIPGHYTWTFDDPLYRILVLRGIAWAGKQENIHRLAELATIGARIAP